MPTELSPTCQKIANTIKGLEGQLQALSDELHEAAPAQKSRIAKEIKEVNAEIAAKKKDLAQCKKDHPFTPPDEPEPLPRECARIAEEIKKLKAALDKEVRDAVAPLQEELHSASPAQKAFIIQQIKRITADIKKNSSTAKKLAARTEAYEDCICEHDGLPALNATFNGTATLWTSNDNAPGPFQRSVNIGLRFSEWDRRAITVTSFPRIEVTYDTNSPAGEVTTAVTLRGASGGTFDPDTNRIRLQLRLFFQHSTSLAGDSTLDITLNTVSPLTSGGDISVEGSAPFQDGYLDEDICSITVKGTISPHPLSGGCS